MFVHYDNHYEKSFKDRIIQCSTAQDCKEIYKHRSFSELQQIQKQLFELRINKQITMNKFRLAMYSMPEKHIETFPYAYGVQDTARHELYQQRIRYWKNKTKSNALRCGELYPELLSNDDWRDIVDTNNILHCISEHWNPKTEYEKIGSDLDKFKNIARKLYRRQAISLEEYGRAVGVPCAYLDYERYAVDDKHKHRIELFDSVHTQIRLLIDQQLCLKEVSKKSALSETIVLGVARNLRRHGDCVFGDTELNTYSSQELRDALNFLSFRGLSLDQALERLQISADQVSSILSDSPLQLCKDWKLIVPIKFHQEINPASLDSTDIKSMLGIPELGRYWGRAYYLRSSIYSIFKAPAKTHKQNLIDLDMMDHEAKMHFDYLYNADLIKKSWAQRYLTTLKFRKDEYS